MESGEEVGRSGHASSEVVAGNSGTGATQVVLWHSTAVVATLGTGACSSLQPACPLACHPCSKAAPGPRPTIITPHGGPHSVYTAQYFMPFAYLVSLGVRFWLRWCQMRLRCYEQRNTSVPFLPTWCPCGVRCVSQGVICFALGAHASG